MYGPRLPAPGEKACQRNLLNAVAGPDWVVAAGRDARTPTGMTRAGAVRLTFCTSAGVESREPSKRLPYRLIVKPLVLQRAYADMRAAEQLITASGLHWFWVDGTPTVAT